MAKKPCLIMCPKCNRVSSFQIDFTEANHAEHESGTTGCSAAGGGIEHVNSVCSAGREPRKSEYEIFLEQRLDYLEELNEGIRTLATKAAVYECDYLLGVYRAIEGRRRNAGCVKPPAG